jgi:MFS family permease
VSHPQIRLGLRENAGQFGLLVLAVVFVGVLVGMERTVLVLLAKEDFALASTTAVLSFLISFGVVKGVANLGAGSLSDRIGRRRVLILGWLVALPVPLLIIWAPSWSWVVAANVLLGVNQGLTWSTTVVMKIDLVGPKQRGLALGLNESAGYMAVAATAVLTGWLAAVFGPRPWPFVVGLVAAVAGLLLTVLFVQDTGGHVRSEASKLRPEPRSLGQVIWQTSVREPALSSASQAGLVNNLNDGVAWGLLPLFLAASGLSVAQIGIVAGVYPAVWGLGQLLTGHLSDRWGRKSLIWTGMLTQGVALLIIAESTTIKAWIAGAAVLGAGTAMVYPTLIAVVSDVAHPNWRASAVGVYRLWRDLGFAAGALVAGLVADRFGFIWSLRVVAALTILSGLVVAARMYETLPTSLEPRSPRSQPV